MSRLLVVAGSAVALMGVLLILFAFPAPAHAGSPGICNSDLTHPVAMVQDSLGNYHCPGTTTYTPPPAAPPPRAVPSVNTSAIDSALGYLAAKEAQEQADRAAEEERQREIQAQRAAEAERQRQIAVAVDAQRRANQSNPFGDGPASHASDNPFLTPASTAQNGASTKADTPDDTKLAEMCNGVKAQYEALLARMQAPDAFRDATLWPAATDLYAFADRNHCDPLPPVPHNPKFEVKTPSAGIGVRG